MPTKYLNNYLESVNKVVCLRFKVRGQGLPVRKNGPVRNECQEFTRAND